MLTVGVGRTAQRAVPDAPESSIRSGDRDIAASAPIPARVSRLTSSDMPWAVIGDPPNSTAGGEHRSTYAKAAPAGGRQATWACTRRHLEDAWVVERPALSPGEIARLEGPCVFHPIAGHQRRSACTDRADDRTARSGQRPRSQDWGRGARSQGSGTDAGGRTRAGSRGRWRGGRLDKERRSGGPCSGGVFSLRHGQSRTGPPRVRRLPRSPRPGTRSPSSSAPARFAPIGSDRVDPERR